MTTNDRDDKGTDKPHDSEALVSQASRSLLSECFDTAVSWVEQPFAVIDFETTGLSPTEDRVLEVGVACFVKGELRSLKSWLVNPETPVSREERAMHHINDEELASAPPFEQVLAEVTAMIDGHLPAA